MRVILVDDEPPARALLREHLGAFPEAEVVAACGTGRAAVEAINEKRPDLVFLDVQMPGLDGFGVLERLGPPLPYVIFSTAYDEHALRAFEAGAVDYLLKPYDQARFEKAMRRALEHHRLRRDPGERLLKLLRAARADAAGHPSRLFVRSGERIVPVETADILWIEAAGDYARLHTAAGQAHLSNLGIGALEEKLDPERFLRVHRSSIIALPALRHLTSDGSGGYVATLTNRARVRVSRSYAPAVRELIG